MFEWSPTYETGIALVDEQHQHLFEMLNSTAAGVETGKLDESTLEASLKAVLEYVIQHFEDEELHMLHTGIDKRHVSLQRMEHSSFIHDVRRMQSFVADEDVLEQGEKLVNFMTSWLVYHTLRTDQVLGIQTAAIKQGMSAGEAFDYAEAKALNPKIYRSVVTALVHLWTDALERVGELENKLGIEQGSRPPDPAETGDG